MKIGNNFTCVLSNSNNFPHLKVREINRIWQNGVRLFPNFTRHHLITHTNFREKDETWLDQEVTMSCYGKVTCSTRSISLCSWQCQIVGISDYFLLGMSKQLLKVSNFKTAKKKCQGSVLAIFATCK